MTYPRDIQNVPPDVARVADMRRRLARLERISGLGHQRDYHEITTRTQITAAAYGLLPVFEVEVHVPEGGWVLFTGSITAYLKAGASSSTRQIWGAIFETTDAADPLYGGVQVYNTQATGTTDFTQTRHIAPASDTGLTDERRPMIYRPAPGNRRYLLDFRRAVGAGGGEVHLEPGSWFGVEVA